MKKILTFILFSTILLSCRVEPEPLYFGKDACYTCKMTLMDQKFGAEIVSKKGKIYKFDDVNCMINFYSSGVEPKENIAHQLVIDFADPENLINAHEAFYIQSENIKSPMTSQVAAFSAIEQCDNHNKEWKGILLTWSKLLTLFK
jgi:copper chaperone NosL